MKTLFEKIYDGEIPANILYKDDVCALINDINPQAPTHLLLFPKKPITGISQVNEEDSQILAHLLLQIPNIEKLCNLQKGYRVVINQGDFGGQTVNHLHIHILGQRQLSWPPG